MLNRRLAGWSDQVRQALAKRHGDTLHLLDLLYCTIALALEASKGRALATIACDLGIARSETLEIGDGANDVPMLPWADRSLATAKADRYAREAADELPPDEVDAVATALEELV